MSLGSIIIHVVVCCCLLAATTGCSNSKDSANAQATQHKAVRNKLSSGAKTLLTVGGSGSGASEVGNTFEEDGGQAPGSRQEGERKDTEQDKGKEALVRLVEGLTDKDAENVYKKIVSAEHPFTQNLAIGMGFQGNKDKDAAKNFKRLLDDVTNKNIARKREFIEVIVSNMYKESKSFKDNIANIRQYVCGVKSGGEVSIPTHKRDHSVGEKNINTNIERGTKKTRGEKEKQSYYALTSEQFGKYIPKLLKCEKPEKEIASAVTSVLNRWFTDLEWQKNKKDGYISYNVEDKKRTKENPYTNLNQAIKHLNSSK